MSVESVTLLPRPADGIEDVVSFLARRSKVVPIGGP